jgi:hypothetical protein
MPKLAVVFTMFLFVGCAGPHGSPHLPLPATQPARLVVNMDGNGDLTLGGGSVSVLESDLPLLVTEAGPDRPVVLYGVGDLKKLVAVRQQFQAAGFKNVTIGAVAGE